MVSFDVSLTEARLITKIAQRAIKEDLVPDFREIEMDITACHKNGCPLDLEKLLNAKHGNFGHDVLGIHRHIDRGNGKLTGLFDPRCSLPAK